MCVKTAVSSVPVKNERSAMTKTIDLGPSVELKAERDLSYSDWNFVEVRRTDDPLYRWWGNLNSKIMSKTILSYDDKPKEWKIKLFNMAQKQYDKYGTYYRILDNSFGDPEADDIYETKEN